MIREATLAALREAQESTCAVVEALDDVAYRNQFHADLSPLGWHAGHCAFIETYWVREVLCGDDRETRALHALYVPENLPKPRRGPALPPAPELLAWARARQAENRARLCDPPRAAAGRRLLRGEYLPRFLIQHYAQHYETMQMVLAQRRLRRPPPRVAPGRPEPHAPARACVRLAATSVEIGSGGIPAAYDNELPAHRVRVGPVRLARRPATNAEFLGFMEDGGYRRAELWEPEGWRRRGAEGLAHPGHWREAPDGGWYEIAGPGERALETDAPVRGLSRYEAHAFAVWAGGRLPHEYEWEAAARAGLLEGVGDAWEWCANPFHPYPGFRAFPYERYSTPWFDGRHYTLRGAGPHTRDAVRRPGFRNFYVPETRYLFAGVRPAYDD